MSSRDFCALVAAHDYMAAGADFPNWRAAIAWHLDRCGIARVRVRHRSRAAAAATVRQVRQLSAGLPLRSRI